MSGRGKRGQNERLRDERYQQLVELSPDGILIHDGERIILANSAALHLAGATHRDQLVGQPIDAFLDPPFLKAAASQLLGSGEPPETAAPVRDTFRRLDGSEIEVEVRARIFMYDGRPSAHIIVRDITERLAVERKARQVEMHLQQAQRMETVGALAGGVAHEINNMMSVVLGFGSFLLRDPAVRGEHRLEAQEIVKAADRAAKITRQLLAFSRRAWHQPRVLDLGAAVRDLEPLIVRLLGEDRHLISQGDNSPRVWFDPGQLEQLVVNLALNARDAMPSGGTLTITTGEAELPNGIPAPEGATIPAGRYGLVRVRDTGCGMDAATIRRIFEPFFTTKPVGHGTGLGLAAAFGIMKQNDGYIRVVSAPGQGAEFSLYLPSVTGTDPDEPPAAPEPEGPGAWHDTATVLLVEDEPGVRAVAARTLELGGFRVLAASDGAHALEVVDHHGRPDLVLTDLIMPGIGGAELARRLRARWPALPVLFMSGYSAEELRLKGAITHEEITVPKPFDPDGLIGRVVAVLYQEAEDDSAANP